VPKLPLLQTLRERRRDVLAFANDDFENARRVKFYWEIIADNLSKAGWSRGYGIGLAICSACLIAGSAVGGWDKDKENFDPRIAWKDDIQKIVSEDYHHAKQYHWNKRDGFTTAPLDLLRDVQAHESQNVRALQDKYGSIWKFTMSPFGEAYGRDQATLNNQRVVERCKESPSKYCHDAGTACCELGLLEPLRSRIRTALELCIASRGGGSASLMLSNLVPAEVERILLQLYVSKTAAFEAPKEMDEADFRQKLRAKVFYQWEGQPLPDDPDFDAALNLFRSAEETGVNGNPMDQKQRTIFRNEILKYL
jgi:hypothetical protein